MNQDIKFGLGWEAGLGNFYTNYYQKILDNLGFHFYKKQEGPGMGALIIFSGHGMLVKIINDRGQYFVSIGNEFGNTKYWDIEFLMAYFKIIEDNISSKEYKKREQILCDTYNWENYAENAKYFFSHFDRIKQLFQSDHYEINIKCLDDLEKELIRYRKKRMNNAC
jgi:hypothetical protein